MKKILFVFLLFLAGCGKSNLWVPPGYPEITENWLVKEGHDSADHSAAFCKWDGVIDTAQLKYSKSPNDPHPYGYFVGDIVVKYELSGRYYKLLLKKL